MVLIKLAFLARGNSHFMAGAQQRSDTHAEGKWLLWPLAIPSLNLNIQAGNELLIICGTFCDVGPWVYFLKQYDNRNNCVHLQGTKLMLGSYN